MPNQKDFQVIPGGKPNGGAAETSSVSNLLDRARRYRERLARRPDATTEGLLADFEDAIYALQRLERSSDPAALPRVAEYRRLIAELDAEILAILNPSPP